MVHHPPHYFHIQICSGNFYFESQVTVATCWGGGVHFLPDKLPGLLSLNIFHCFCTTAGTVTVADRHTPIPYILITTKRRRIAEFRGVIMTKLLLPCTDPSCEPNLNEVEVLHQESIHCCDFSSFLVCYVLFICDIKNYI